MEEIKKKYRVVITETKTYETTCEELNEFDAIDRAFFNLKYEKKYSSKDESFDGRTFKFEVKEIY
jgi:hypothetical protein